MSNTQIIQTGLLNPDTKIGGFKPWDFYILGGRSASGKTSIANYIIVRWFTEISDKPY